jgi:hypothetical protein
MLVAYWKFSPYSQGPLQPSPVDPKKDPIPDLKRWSDVGYLKWADQASKRNVAVDSLRYIFSAPIENSETLGIIARAINSEQDPPTWPGRKEYRMDTAEGKALMGSPNGRGAALLLVQHKDTMGERRTIDKVAVFSENGDTNLLFYLSKPASASKL